MYFEKNKDMNKRRPIPRVRVHMLASVVYFMRYSRAQEFGLPRCLAIILFHILSYTLHICYVFYTYFHDSPYFL